MGPRQQCKKIECDESQILPSRYAEFLRFYDVFDKAYVFLVKHRIKCTIGKVVELCSQLALLTDVTQSTEYSIINKNHIVRLVKLCPTLFQFNEEHNDKLCEIHCLNFPGTGVGHIKSRRNAILESIWTHLAKSSIISRNGTESFDDANMKKVVKNIKKRGLENSIDYAAILFPDETPSNTGSSASLSTSSSSPLPSLSTMSSSTELNNDQSTCDSPFAHVIEHLKSSAFYTNQIKHVISYPGQEAKFQQLQNHLPPYLENALKNRLGIQNFYQHQAKAIDAIREGKHVIISTSTSSGKSLIYNIPVFESILADRTTTAMYLFPTKALSQDQLRAIIDFVRNDQTNIIPVVCDGDVSTPERTSIQQSHGNIIITNPDMMHHTLLPDHKKWIRLFQNLRWIVLDEAHQYSGAFGAHVACVLRRLIRVCRYYGCSPQFILCSATIANPAEHIRRLVPFHLFSAEADLEVVTNRDDGSPHGERNFLIWNPYDHAGGSKQAPENESLSSAGLNHFCYDTEMHLEEQKFVSPIMETAKLFASLVKLQQRTIAFCGTRKLVELVFKYSVRFLEQWKVSHLSDFIATYRGGYTETERRLIERKLFNNELIGVAATCALELGIDVGSLDVTLHMGFPGSFSSLWQQAGRAGRSGKPSLSIIMCFDSALDQYFAKNPKILLESDFEKAILDVENVHILKSHLACAAKEIPLNYPFEAESRLQWDYQLWGSNYLHVVEVLLKSFKLQTIPLDKKMAAISSSYQPLYRFWSEGSHAANEAAKEVSLRNIDPITISVLNERNELMDSVEYSRAFFELYDGAIILQRGLQYQVIKLDLLSNTAVTRRVRVPYYTSGKNETQINIIKSIEVDGLFHYGVVQVVAKVNGFYKRKLGTGEIFEEGACSLPPLEYETTAIWVDLPVSLKLNIEKAGHSLHESIHACNHVLVSISPMLGQCDPRDIGTEHIVSGGAREHPLRIMLFDKRPGGLGSCAALFTYRAQVISSAMAILSGCLCSEGCPSCILEKRCTAHNRHICKSGAIFLLGELKENYIGGNASSNIASTPGTVITESPNKRAKHLNLQQTVAMRESERSRNLKVQKLWTTLAPDFITETDCNSHYS